MIGKTYGAVNCLCRLSPAFWCVENLPWRLAIYQWCTGELLTHDYYWYRYTNQWIYTPYQVDERGTESILATDFCLRLSTCWSLSTCTSQSRWNLYPEPRNLRPPRGPMYLQRRMWDLQLPSGTSTSTYLYWAKLILIRLRMELKTLMVSSLYIKVSWSIDDSDSWNRKLIQGWHWE